MKNEPASLAGMVFITIRMHFQKHSILQDGGRCKRGDLENQKQQENILNGALK